MFQFPGSISHLIKCFGLTFLNELVWSLLIGLFAPIDQLQLSIWPTRLSSLAASTFLGLIELVQTGLADPHLLVDLELRNLRLVLAARAAEEPAAGPAVVAPLVDGEPDAAADARLGALVLAPVVDHACEGGG